MRNHQNKNKKGLLKNLAYGAVGLALLGGTYITISNSNLKPEDFSKAKWIELDNENRELLGLLCK